MDRYYVNERSQQNGDHEVHKNGCYWLALAVRTRYLGEHWSCVTALQEAQRFYPTANGCRYCSPSCHSQ